MEKIIKFIPAFDKRHSDPSKNYGIGAMNCFMILKDKDKAVHFLFSTGIYLPETVGEYIANGKAKYEKMAHGYYYFNKPMAFDVGYHDTKPHYKEQKISQDKCTWTGKPCYSDGSALRSDKFLDILVRKGSDEVWKMLERELEDLK